MRQTIFTILLIAVLAFAFPSAAGATPAAQTVTICWKTWVVLDQCVSINTDTYADPTIKAKWNGGFPFFGATLGGSWDVSHEGGSFNVPTNNFTVTSTNPNLPYITQVDGSTDSVESGIIDSGHEFMPWSNPQIGVSITIGQ